MSKFRNWGLTVVTMVSVATVVLLVTGWGSALASSLSTSVVVANTSTNPAKVHETNTDSSGNMKVHEQGIAKVAVQNVDANGNIKVHEQGNANVKITNTSDTPVPVSGSVAITGTPTVNVGNFPNAPKTDVIASGSNTVLAAFSGWLFLVGLTDVSAYREVTFDVEASTTGSGGQCSGYVKAGSAYFQTPPYNASNGVVVSHTYDAPPSIEIFCDNPTSQEVDLTWALVGRSG